MVSKIRERRVDFNNNADISQSKIKTNIKLLYYRVILLCYKIVRVSISAAQANSTWTYDHMIKLWGNNIVKLYPPCSIS
jgi:alpha-1,2-mannosyltransferase